MNKRLSVWMLIGILFLSVIIFLFWANNKEGYHMDEIYSFGLSNSKFHYDVFDESGNIRWNTPEDFNSYLTVTEQHVFDYANVYKNQAEDVHPPLFYFIIHTIASCFPGTVSPYFAIVPNIIFSLATMILLYFIAMYILQNRCASLLTVLLYALSTGCVNMVIFVRMYSMLAFFTTCALYLHIRLYKREYSLTPSLATGLATTIFFGALTQYYFFIFMATLAVFVAIDMLRKKQTKKLFQYIGLIAVVAGLYILIWPHVFPHLFTSSRGEEAFSNLTNSSPIISFLWYLNAIREGQGTLLFAIFATVLFFYLISFIRACRNKNKTRLSGIVANHAPALSVGLITSVYLLLVVVAAPYQTMRYITPLFPLISLLFVYVLRCSIKTLSQQKNIRQKTLLIASSAIIIVGIGSSVYESFFYPRTNNIPIGLHYPVSDELKNVFENHSNNKCVMIYSYPEQYLWNFQDYSKFRSTAFVPVNTKEEFFKKNTMSDEEKFVLCISYLTDHNAIAKEIAENLDFKHALIADTQWRNFTKTYLLYRK